MMFAVVVGFLTFFCLHAVSLRLLPRPRLVYCVLVTLVISWMGGVVGTWFLAHDLFSLVSLSLVVMCYVLGVLVIVDSSIHVRILLLIAERENGLLKKELLVRYNRETIITRRLARLVNTGELHHRRGRYRLANKRSPLLVRERVSRIIEWLFP